MTEKNQQLTREQVELLYDAKRMDSPRMVEADDLETIREALSAPLKDLGMRDGAIESMSVAALARQFAPSESDEEDEAGTLTLESLAQDPETGGVSGDEANDGVEDLEDPEPERIESVEALAQTVTPSEANDVADKLSLIAALQSRDIEKRSSELSEELAEEVNAETSVIEGLTPGEWGRQIGERE